MFASWGAVLVVGIGALATRRRVSHQLEQDYSGKKKGGVDFGVGGGNVPA